MRVTHLPMTIARSIISDFDRKRILKAVLVDVLMIVCGIAGHLGTHVAFSGEIIMMMVLGKANHRAASSI